MTTVENVAPAAPVADEPSRLEALVDRLNPILIREVQQALSGRSFQALLALSTFAVVGLGVAFAWYGGTGEENGRVAFAACLACLAPIVLLLLPMQAFHGMRQEVSGGGADQLALTRLSPLRIVTGKIGAGFAQFLVFLSLFAPVMALTFLLRGVDVATIALVLMFAALSSLAANALCIAIAPVGRTRAIQQLLQGLVAAGLMVTTISVMFGSYEITRELGSLTRTSHGTAALVGMVGLFVLGIALSAIIGTAALSHPHENRSTAFRVFAAAGIVLVGVWLILAVEPRFLADAAPVMATVMAFLGIPFWLWASCEDAPMSPRVRTLVPRAPLHLLAAPFLPGGKRGVLFTLVLAALALGMAAGIPWVGGVQPDAEEGRRALTAWSYAVILAVFARALRSRFGPGTGRSVLALVLVVTIVAIGCILPPIFELLVAGRVTGEWHAYRVLNPIDAIFNSHLVRAFWIVGPIALIAMLVAVPSMLSGLVEVHTARKAIERRRRDGAD